MTGLILGGDLRQFYLAKRLEQSGFEVLMYRTVMPAACMDLNLKELPNTEIDFWVLPIPISNDQKTVKTKETEKPLLLDEVIQVIAENSIVFGGLFPLPFKKKLIERKIEWVDLMESPYIAQKNAIATAEGVIAEAIQLSSRNLHQSSCLVLGFGRCAQVLADKLKGLSCNVSVSCRNREARCVAESMGYLAFGLQELRKRLGDFDFVFNTIPAPVLGENKLCKCNPNVVILDIASSPGGCDWNYVKQQSICAKLCLSLPGIYAPEASGEILAQEIVERLTISGVN